jgi:AraC-like DNA-binding protein
MRTESIMDYVQEKFNLDSDFPFLLFETDGKQALMHQHDFLEINLVVSGNGYYIIEDQRYSINPSNIFIINNSERHMAVHDSDFLILVFIFDTRFIWDNPDEFNYLKPFLDRNSTFKHKIDHHQECYRELSNYLNKTVEEYNAKVEGWQMVVKASIMMFLALLYRYYKNNNELGSDSGCYPQKYKKIKPVLDYCYDHLSEPISLDCLAKLVMLNKSYMCYCFKEAMNITIFEYIEQIRINHACRLLVDSDCSIIEVAFESGFNSASYFNRVFKKTMGLTPKKYKIMMYEKSKDNAIIS